MSCAEQADVTAMYVTMSTAMAPRFPRRVTATAGVTSPAPCCAALNGKGYVGHAGFDWRARPERPIIEPKAKGTLNHEIPPKKYAFVVPFGLDAIARCQ